MDLNTGEKNSKLSKELNSNEEVNLKTRLFQFFYYVLRKKDINLLLATIFLILESFQLISYAFSDPHTDLWKINSDTMYYIKLIVAGSRVAPLMTLISFNLYLVIYAFLIVFIFLHALIFATTLRINKVNSKFYQSVVTFTRYSASAIQIFLLIPIAELLLLMLKCDENSQINLFSDSITCWKGLHFLYSFLSVIFCIVFFLSVSILTVFYFDPFNTKKTATKTDTTADSFLFIFKIIAVIRYIGLSSDWISIVIMVIASLLNMKRSYENATYNNTILECIIAIRNAAVFWTYLVLLISKVLSTSSFNGQIFLLLIGYPLIIAFSIFYYKRRSKNFMITNSNFNDANEYLVKLKYLKILIESFLTKNKSSKSNKSNNLKKDEILLKGYITIHEETCVIEECPLKKFLDDSGNFTLQKTSLLHYMNQMYQEGIKKFPNSKTIIMNYVQFNYEKKYNLNSAKAFLTKLEKSQNTITEDFVLYSMKQNMNSNSSSGKLNRSYTNDDEVLKIEDTIEHKFKRMKTLIETATKLYGEFWGSLSTNLTNNLNLKKLFFVGNKLNRILNEINTLWENDLKNKKIDIENQATVQLYSYFLREILKNKKKSEEISKKLNEEQHYENKKTENDRLDLENIDLVLENQEMVIYSRASEKGEITVIQCSNSIVAMLGYTKQEIIGKRAETLMPSIFIDDHATVIGARIKNMRTTFNIHKDAFKSAVEKKLIFILPKTKTGYLVPINTRFSVYNDDDFSNAYIVKSRFENKDTKSVYAFYILTRDDFTIESITSSCLNLSLTMDLLKKYVINMNYLIRNELFEEMDLGLKFQDYEEEPKKVFWVYPDLLYPKTELMDISLKSDMEREKLIHDSKREAFNLLVSRFKYKEDETIGYSFRLTPIEQRRHNQESADIKLNFNPKKNIMYDMMKLNYMRTTLVTVKKKIAVEQIAKAVIAPTFTNSVQKAENGKKGRKKRRKSEDSNMDSSEEAEKALEDNIITKEKLSEYQARGAEDIKNFINGLVFFGENISLYKRDTELKNPYEDHYNKQPLIKQTLDEFNKKMSARKSLEKKDTNKNRDSIASVNSSASTDISANLDYMSDTSSSLNNIFNEKSVSNIRFFSFFMFVLLCIIISIEFFISLSIIKDSNDRMFYADKAFKILNSLLYTKFFITEAIIAQSPSYKNIGDYYQGNNTKYIIDMMAEMSNYRQIISDTYSFFSNATVTFDQRYYDYINTQPVYIRTLSNGLPSVIINPFPIAISRIPTTIFYVSTVNDNYNQINMYNRNAYELMMNLLNDYFLVWRDVTLIIVNDVKEHLKPDSRLLIIFALSFVISIISIFGIRLLINKFIDDREKPVDLFLTIKKQKFEELKFSSEAFLNKLLNKFFGNEEAEEEMMSDTGIKINSDDIIIAKFKQKNEYKQSIRTSSEYLLIFFKISIFFFIFQGYMAFKYVYITLGMQNLDHFTDVFNVTQYSQSDLILSTNVAK
jgi:hypothetical protein